MNRRPRGSSARESSWASARQTRGWHEFGGIKCCLVRTEHKQPNTHHNTQRIDQSTIEFSLCSTAPAIVHTKSENTVSGATVGVIRSIVYVTLHELTSFDDKLIACDLSAWKRFLRFRTQTNGKAQRRRRAAASKSIHSICDRVSLKLAVEK